MSERLTDIVVEHNPVVLPEATESVTESRVEFSAEKAKGIHDALHRAQNELTPIVHLLYIRHEDHLTDLIDPDEIPRLQQAVLEMSQTLNTANDLEGTLNHLETIHRIFGSMKNSGEIDKKHDSHPAFLYLAQKLPRVATDMERIAHAADESGLEQGNRVATVARGISESIMQNKSWMEAQAKALDLDVITFKK